MKLEENLKDSYNYTSKLFKDAGRLIILIVLNIIPIVNFIVTGFFARVIRESPKSEAPPPLEKYGELWVEGAKIVVVTIVYMIVPIILISFGAASMAIGLAFFPLLAFGILGVILFVVGIILAFLISIFAIMGVVHMVKTGKMGEAFNINAILSKIRAIGWINYIVWLLVIFVISLVVVGLASLVPFVGWLIALIVSPPLEVFIGRSASNVYEITISGVEKQVQKYCGNCGNPIGPEDKYCGNCGKPVG